MCVQLSSSKVPAAHLPQGHLWLGTIGTTLGGIFYHVVHQISTPFCQTWPVRADREWESHQNLCPPHPLQASTPWERSPPITREGLTPLKLHLELKLPWSAN